jgi:hypothetical protein
MAVSVAAGVFVALVSAAFAATAAGLAESLSDADKQCLGCHAGEGLTKTLANGDTLSLHIEGEAFARSVHRAIGCSACHAKVDLKTHPGTASDVKSARQYSIESAGICRQCHEDALKQHDGSVHAKRIAEGSTVAPTCTGCHGAHAVTPKTAYQTCVNCHSAALAAHQKWLPNAARHHEVVSCAACHAPAAPRMVDLRLYDPATKTWATEKPNEPWFEKLARTVDANGDGIDARELLSLVSRINPEGATAPRTFRGRIELRNNVEAHRLSDKAGAIKACDVCHRAGAEPFRNVTLSVTGPDGRPVRHPAQPEILGGAFAVISLPEFYAIGGTRSALLDVLFVLALLGGAGFPIGHMAVRWLSRKNRS